MRAHRENELVFRDALWEFVVQAACACCLLKNLKCHLFLRDFKEDVILHGLQYLKNKVGLDLLFALKTDERSRKPKTAGFEPARERKPIEVGGGDWVESKYYSLIFPAYAHSRS